MLKPESENAYLQIRVNDQIYGEYELDKDQTIAIKKTNKCVIKDQKVYMSDANCPDQICVHSKSIDKKGGTIICMPNQIVLEIINGENEVDTTAS